MEDNNTEAPTRWAIHNTWNGGDGGLVVEFVSKLKGGEGMTQCMEWIHQHTSFSFSEATTNQGYSVVPATATEDNANMRKAEMDEIKHLDRAELESRASREENRARAELADAETARGMVGQPQPGSESWATISARHQRLAATASSNATIYREAISALSPL